MEITIGFPHEWKFDRKQITNILLDEPDIVSRLTETENLVNENELTQESLDQHYDQFCKIIDDAMKTNITSYTVKTSTVSSKKRRRGKPWWINELTELWNNFCEAEKLWTKSDRRKKPRLKNLMKDRQRAFDKATQQAKRKYWKSQQEYLLSLPSRNPGEFWKYIGRIGVGNERGKSFPMEVILENGTVCSNKETVQQT